MMVLDASAGVDLLIGAAPSSQIVEHVREHDYDLHAPHLIDAEIGQALRGKVLGRTLKTTDAMKALAELDRVPIERYPHRPFADRAFAFRSNLTFYDALYLALAEALDATLLTRDAALAKVARRSVDVALVD